MNRVFRTAMAYLVTGFSCLAALAVAILVPRSRAQRAFDRVIATWSRGVLRTVGIRYQIRGQVPTKPPFVLISNHQSLLDVLAVLAACPEVRIIAKAELFRVPLFGPAMRSAGFLKIDRANRERAWQTIRDAAQEVRRGASIMLFPEGTRSQDGALRPFKKGAFALAAESRVPVVPMAIYGTQLLLP